MLFICSALDFTHLLLCILLICLTVNYSEVLEGRDFSCSPLFSYYLEEHLLHGRPQYIFAELILNEQDNVLTKS